MPSPKWLREDVLASFNNDTFRAELSPRRCDAKGNIITPEEAKKLEDKLTSDYKAAKRDGKKPPNKRDYCFVDARAKHHPRVWKCYELKETGRFLRDKDGPVLDKDKNPVPEKRFLRVGEYAEFDDVLKHVGSL